MFLYRTACMMRNDTCPLFRPAWRIMRRYLGILRSRNTGCCNTRSCGYAILIYKMNVLISFLWQRRRRYISEKKKNPAFSFHHIIGCRLDAGRIGIIYDMACDNTSCWEASRSSLMRNTMTNFSNPEFLYRIGFSWIRCTDAVRNSGLS